MNGMRWKTLAAAVGLWRLWPARRKGCSCAEPIKGGFPVAERHESAMQVRATQSLFKYFSRQRPDAHPQLVAGGSTFNVPPSWRLEQGVLRHARRRCAA